MGILSSSIFGQLMNAWDLASKMDQMRMVEQNTRLSQQRSAAASQAATVQPRVAVKDGYELVRTTPVSLSDSQPIEVETRGQLKSFRRNEAVDAALAAQRLLNEK